MWCSGECVECGECGECGAVVLRFLATLVWNELSTFFLVGICPGPVNKDY